MKFLDLEAQYQSIKKEVDAAINRVIQNSSFIMGDEVAELEQKIAEYVGVPYAVGLNSGSDALTASLIALGITPGDEVIVPTFTYIATAEAVAIAGGKIVFVDINPKTFNVDPKLLEAAITKKTKAIIPVHLYGQAAEMDAIMAIAQKHKLYVIEDCAQAIGAEYNGKKVGSFGTTGCFSFFPTKNLGAYGDGGMVVTSDKKIAEYLRQWRIHGQPKKYYTDFVGASSRLDTMQAAILLAKLPYLDDWNAKRQRLAARYDELLVDSKITTPSIAPGASHVYHQYTIKVKKRDSLRPVLQKIGIPTMVYYPEPLHVQKAYADLGYKKEDFPHSMQASSQVLSLPIFPELKDTTQTNIINTLLSRDCLPYA
ncbi:MAG: DegT/DnrJ/EryC1/StrS family aminotransferase [Patescibacteria group bacterium]